MKEESDIKKDYFLHIVITEIICIAIILFSVFICKLFFKGEFKTFSEYYETYATQKTRVEEVVESV